MNRDEQKEFVKSLCQTIADTIVTEIDNGKVSDNWDGIELRALIARETADGERYLHRNRSRLLKFNNTCLVNNL